MNTTRWAIAGTGSIAGKFAQALNSISNAEITAVYSRSAEKAADFAKKHKVSNHFSDFDKLLECDFDILYIAAPHSEHYPLMRRAVLAHKNVFCEKPFTVNSVQTEEIINLAEENGVFAVEAMCTAYLPVFKKMTEWINSGKIGNIKEIHANFHIDSSAERLVNKNLAGGALLDVGVYPLMLINSVFGSEPTDIRTKAEFTESGVDFRSMTAFEYGDKQAVMSIGLDYSFSNNALIIGDKGAIEIPHFSCADSIYMYVDGKLEAQEHFPHENHLYAEAEAVSGNIFEYSTAQTLAVMRLCDRLRAEWNLKYPSEIENLISKKKENPVTPLNNDPEWFRDAVFYHIYPLGFCGAPEQNNFTAPAESRILSLVKYAEHIREIGANALYLGPVFESSAHGYDTADYKTVDRRLGTNEDLKSVVRAMHENGIRVILDGVFNHVGRDFWAFRDVREKKWDSPYKDWFIVNFDGNSNYNDGFWYEGWEGHFELVKFNLFNPAVRNYLIECVRDWMRDFGIDGLRLDVAYSLNHDFIRELNHACKSENPAFFLLGEMLHGDYNTLCRDGMLDSVTNYECYKGIYSSVNCGNMHEIGYSLNRQFGPEQWTLYKGKNLYCFADNHDVSRIATIITDREKLPAVYGLLFSMPGIPSVYYGGEWGMEGDKTHGDKALRPFIDINNIPQNHLSEYIKRLAEIRKSTPALCWGDYLPLYTMPNQLAFARRFDGQTVIAAFNFDSNEHTAHFNAPFTRGTDLITSEKVSLENGLALKPKTAMIIIAD